LGRYPCRGKRRAAVERDVLAREGDIPGRTCGGTGADRAGDFDGVGLGRQGFARKDEIACNRNGAAAALIRVEAPRVQGEVGAQGEVGPRRAHGDGRSRTTDIVARVYRNRQQVRFRDTGGCGVVLNR